MTQVVDNTFYRGNSNLKPQGIKIEWTEELQEEYIRCALDPIYFAENYIKVVHPDDGLVLITLYDYQKEIIRMYQSGRFTAVNTSRQAGKTTVATIIILHYMLFNEYKTVALTANKGDSAREILARIQISFESLPKWLQQGVVEWNKGSVHLENGCKVFAGSTSSSSIRGTTVQLLYIDETAFVEHWDEFFASVFPTITAGKNTKVILTSTPNGMNHFYKTCEGGRKGTNGYQYIEVPWYKVPGRDEQWKKETLDGLDGDMDKFNQEFACVTGDTVVTVRDKETGEIKKMSIKQLYDEIRENMTKYEIKTPTGWSDFETVIEKKSQVLTIMTDSGKQLECTRDHRLYSKYGFLEAEHFEVDDVVLTSAGWEKIIFIDFIGKTEKVYDIVEVQKKNQYYTNGFVSHNCSFIGSSSTLISGAKLKTLVWQDPIKSFQNIKVYEDPIPDHVYSVVVDTSRGRGLDYSAFQVIDVTKIPYKQVATFRDNTITPLDYAHVIFQIAKTYNEAHVLVESNDIGGQVVDSLYMDLEYENILYSESAGRVGKRISAGFGKSAERGIRTTKSVKSVGCNTLKMLVEQDKLIINDFDTIKELSRFSRKGNSYEAETGAHDDTVMCLVLFAWLTDQIFFKDLTDINTLAALREQTEEQLENSMLPFGFYDDGREPEVDEYIHDVPGSHWLL